MAVEVMSFKELIEGRIVARLSRFVVVVVVGGERVMAYLANSGRLEQFIVPGATAYLIRVSETHYRKLRYKLVGVRDREYATVVDTKIHEQAFERVVDRGLIPWLNGFRVARRYPRLGPKIFDFLLENRETGEKLVVELKSAILRLPNDTAGYPDAPTSRGREHLRLLADLANRYGYKAMVVFVCALPGVKRFQLYCGVDKEIGKAARYAHEMGVAFKAIGMYLDPYKAVIVLENPDVPVDLNCYIP
jgi:sugar fermentation stimulation protein A